MPHNTSLTGKAHARTLIVMAAILVVCAVGYFAATRAAEVFDPAEESTTGTLLSVSQDDITAISWDYEGGSYQLALGDDTWADAENPSVAVNQTSAEELASALAQAETTRAIGEDALSEDMGLGDPSATVKVSLQDGSEVALSVGAQTADGAGYYVAIDGEEGGYVADTSLGCFFTTMMDLYQRDSSPAATTVDSLVLERNGATTLSFAYNENGAKQSYTADYTWNVSDGTAQIATSDTNVSTTVGVVNYVSWDSLVAVSGADDASYGFDSPTLTATLAYTTSSEEDTDEVNEDGETVTEVVETPHTFVLTVGAQTSEGAYYARCSESDMVYTLAAEDVETLLSANLDALRADDVCLMDWDTVDSIDITAGSATKTLAITRTEQTNDDGETETTTSYAVGDSEIDASDAENLLDAIDALESEGEGTADAAEESAPEISFTLHRNTEDFSEMTLGFTKYDNSFYLVSFNGEQRLLVNRNDVAELVELVSEW